MLFKRKEKKKSRVAKVFKSGIGMEAHRVGWSLIRSPAELLRKRKETSENPDELKQLSFDELLDRWQIPRDKIPRLKRILVIEMAAYFLLMGLFFIGVGYSLSGQEKTFYSVLLGLLVGFAAFLQLLLRHHWYSIMARQKYRTFRDYLLRREG